MTPPTPDGSAARRREPLSGAVREPPRAAEAPPEAPPEPPPPRGLVARTLATLDPGSFALVMAGGIVSDGTAVLGEATLSRVVLGVTTVAFVLLAAAYLARVAWFRPWFRRSLRDPTTAMAYFTLVAGTDVLAVRLSIAGHRTVELGMAAAAAVLWLVLTYGLPWAIVALARRPVLGEINGTWLIWVVSTQSLSVVAADLAPSAPSHALREALPTVAVCLWGVGVMLYVVLITIILLRLLLVELTPAEMGPAYWIAMGATAISVRAAAGILALHGPGAATLVQPMRPFLVGLSVVLWAFGTWWIPLLIGFGIWRHLVRRYPTTYEPRLWNIVFPLGMYTVASDMLGRTAGLGFMTTIAGAWVYVGAAAWAAVLAMMAAAAVLAVRRHRAAASA